jgi:hypothetical protein
VKLPAEHRRDDRAGDDAGGGDADHELRIVLSRDFQREGARELAEKWPLHMQNSL